MPRRKKFINKRKSRKTVKNEFLQDWFCGSDERLRKFTRQIRCIESAIARGCIPPKKGNLTTSQKRRLEISRCLFKEINVVRDGLQKRLNDLSLKKKRGSSRVGRIKFRVPPKFLRYQKRFLVHIPKDCFIESLEKQIGLCAQAELTLMQFNPNLRDKIYTKKDKIQFFAERRARSNSRLTLKPSARIIPTKSKDSTDSLSVTKDNYKIRIALYNNSEYIYLVRFKLPDDKTSNPYTLRFRISTFLHKKYTVRFRIPQGNLNDKPHHGSFLIRCVLSEALENRCLIRFRVQNHELSPSSEKELDPDDAAEISAINEELEGISRNLSAFENMKRNSSVSELDDQIHLTRPKKGIDIPQTTVIHGDVYVQQDGVDVPDIIEIEEAFPNFEGLNPGLVCIFNSRRPEQGRPIGPTTSQSIAPDGDSDLIAKRMPTIRLNEKGRLFSPNRERKNQSIETPSRRIGPGVLRSDISNYDNYFSIECCESCLCLTFCDQIMTLGDRAYQRIRHLNLDRLMQSSRICRHCFMNCKVGKTPKLFCDEKMIFPIVPPEISRLNNFECILVAPRIPFMRLRNEINPGKQFSIIGNVNNISIDLGTSIKRLIELTSGTERYFLRLKRKWEFERAYLDGIFRLGVVCQALRYLLNTELYIMDGVRLDVERISKYLKIPEESQVTEVEEEVEEFVYANFNYETADIVPAQDGFFRNVVMDHNGEWLTFPKIYCGKALDYGVLNYKSQCISEFLRFDPRCRKNITKIFYSYMKYISLEIQQSINLFFYRKRFLAELKAKEIGSLAKMQESVTRGDADVVLRGIPTSPKYWFDKKKQLIAMIKQLGPPSFFITLSPEENKDDDLIRFLLNHSRGDPHINVSGMSKAERNKLIAEDPVMVVMYNHRKLTRTLNETILDHQGMFRENMVTDYFYRVEFQKRGSPHLHILTWNEGINTSAMDNEQLISVAEQYISVSKVEGLDLSTQVHKHMKNCKDLPSDISESCQKGFPKFISDETLVLEKSDGLCYQRQLCDVGEEIRIYHEVLALNSVYEDGIGDIEVVINDLSLSREQYFDAIRSLSSQKTILMRRNVAEIMMNNYNVELFRSHRSNMDIQLILDPFGLANYITGYMLKTEFEKIELLDKVVEEIRASTPGFKKQLDVLQNKYQNMTRVSAQECVWTLLNLPLTKCSRPFVTVDTGPLLGRKLILKVQEQIRSLDPEDTDVFKKSAQDYYKVRPNYMNDICLAEFATSYTFTEKKISNCRREIPIKSQRGYVGL